MRNTYKLPTQTHVSTDSVGNKKGKSLRKLHLIGRYQANVKPITHTNAPRCHGIECHKMGYLLRGSKVVAISSAQMVRLI